MDLVTAFNNLDGKEVSRSVLKSLLVKAKKQKHSVISKRIANVLQQNEDTLFTIEIKDFVEPMELTGANQRIFLPFFRF